MYKMKYLAVALLAFWMMVAFVMAGGNEDENTQPEGGPIEKNEQCWWTGCSSNPHCGRGTFRRERRCRGGRSYYCCSSGGGHD
ncbi:unnamed protein product [Cunninghamella blakesleeana]